MRATSGRMSRLDQTTVHETPTSKASSVGNGDLGGADTPALTTSDPPTSAVVALILLAQWEGPDPFNGSTVARSVKLHQQT